MPMIRVLLADDHAVLRDSLRAFLSLHPDIEVVGEAADGAEAVAQVRSLRPDLLLLDLAMPGIGGLEVLRAVRGETPECQVLVLTQHEAPDYILAALQSGARGYLLKRAGGAEGGSSTLTQAARELLRRYRELTRGLDALVDGRFREAFG